MNGQSYDVQLFGPYADAAGASVVRIALPAGLQEKTPTASELMDAIARAQPQLRPMLKETRLAVNREFAAPERMVHRDDELALIGLVAGG